jgi:hypothetical protein
MTDALELPEQTIILDRDLAKRHPSKGFYLRVTRSSHHIDHVDLDGQHTLPGAVRAADELGYRPTHWMTVGHSHFSKIPESIVRKEPAAAAATPKAPSL